MAHLPLTLRLIFTFWAGLQLAVILANVVLGIQASNSLAYLSLIDLPFPIFGLVAIWRFEDEERDPDDRRCLKMHVFMLVYWLWCLLWFVIGLILLLGRAHVFTVPDSETSRAFFGDLTQPAVPSVIIINSIQVAIQFIGFMLGLGCWMQMREHKKASVQPGFI